MAPSGSALWPVRCGATWRPLLPRVLDDRDDVVLVLRDGDERRLLGEREVERPRGVLPAGAAGLDHGAAHAALEVSGNGAVSRQRSSRSSPLKCLHLQRSRRMTRAIRARTVRLAPSPGTGNRTPSPDVRCARAQAPLRLTTDTPRSRRRSPSSGASSTVSLDFPHGGARRRGAGGARAAPPGGGRDGASRSSRSTRRSPCDLDQAMHIERRGKGYRVRYAIADVAAFVDPGGPMDVEAHERGETLYAPDENARLYPPVLSEGAGEPPPRPDASRRSSGRWTSTRRARASR